MVGCGTKDPDFIQFVKNGFCLLDDGDGIRRLSEAPVCDGPHSRVMQEMAFQPTALLNKRDIINIQHCQLPKSSWTKSVVMAREEFGQEAQLSE